MKKLTATFLLFTLLLILFTPFGANAKEQVDISPVKDRLNESGEINTVIYVGQTSRLSFTYNEKIIDPAEVKWTITKGKGKVKVSKDKTSITGKKKGKAVLKGKYKDKTLVVKITIKKKIKPKACKIPVGPVSIAIPSGFIKEMTYDSANINKVGVTSVTGNVAITVIVKDSDLDMTTLGPDKWDDTVNGYVVGLAVNRLDRLLSDYALNGFVVTPNPDSLVYSVIASGMATASCSAEIDYYGPCWLGSIYWLEDNNKLVSISVVAYNEGAGQAALLYMRDNNY